MYINKLLLSLTCILVKRVYLKFKTNNSEKIAEYEYFRQLALSKIRYLLLGTLTDSPGLIWAY